MGAVVSKQVERRKTVAAEAKLLASLLESAGDHFLGYDYHPADRKTWMEELDASRLRLDQVVWPGTHDSATNKIGIPFVSRPFAQCQDCSIYAQLSRGARVLDVRVNQDRRVCHGVLATYAVDRVLSQLKTFLADTRAEVVVLEIRTEFGHDDPPGFDAYLTDFLGDLLIPHEESLLHKPVAEVLPRRVICVWKPRKAPQPPRGGALWPAVSLRDNWIDTDLPSTKFESNMRYMSDHPPVNERSYLYRVENTVTPQADNPVVCVKPVTNRIHGYARLFISQAFARGVGNRLQVFSTDFIDDDFVDACAGVTHARVQGKA